MACERQCTHIGSQNRASVIGLYVSYAAPIFLRITSGRNKLVPGVFSLGKWYLPIGAIAVAWVTFVVILLCFPAAQAVPAQEMSTCLDFITFARGPLIDSRILQIMQLSLSWGCLRLRHLHGCCRRVNGSVGRSRRLMNLRRPWM